MTREERIAYVVKNQKEIIRMKKAKDKFVSAINIISVNSDKAENSKAFKTKDKPGEGEIMVKLVANTYGWFDHDQDVLMKDCFKQSIKDNPNIFHLHDHLFQIAAKVGEVKAVYEQEFTYAELGIEGEGKTQCLVVESLVKESLNKNIYNQYKNGEVNQHSVGMRYGYLVLCVNSQESYYKNEYASWNKYFGYVINKEKCEEYGYFFAVLEATLKEASCVLAGANEITPTLEVIESEDKSSDPVDEDEDDDKSKAGSSGIDVKAAKQFLAKEFLTNYL